MNRFYLYLIIILFFGSGYFAVNGFLKNKINLGLDLVGGSSLTLEADFSDYISEINQSLINDIKQEFPTAEISEKDNVIKFITNNKIEGQKTELEKIINKSGSYQVIYNKNEIIIKPNLQYLKFLKSDAIQQSIKNIQKRVDSTGNREISIQSLGENRILLQAPGFNNPEDLRYAVGKTAKLTFHLMDEKGESNNIKLLKDSYGNQYRVIQKVEIDGKNIKNAFGSTNHNGQNTVNFALDSVGTDKFSHLTSENVGKRLAVVIDDEVVTAPSIRERITAGNVEISGNFDFNSARNLASSLRAGALPVKLNIIEEKTVGASLGVILITAGKKSLIISFLVVTIFMIAIYGMLGIIASLAILINLFIVIGIMIVTNSTLSLAGIAGLVLTVGMVVDSNVLIFERIKEELKKNEKAFISAINVGFDRAIATIIDSNVTTIIASVLLLWFGDTNIKGFAITLTFGVLISFFSAVSFSRILIRSFENSILRYSFWLNRSFKSSNSLSKLP